MERGACSSGGSSGDGASNYRSCRFSPTEATEGNPPEGDSWGGPGVESPWSPLAEQRGRLGKEAEAAGPQRRGSSRLVSLSDRGRETGRWPANGSRGGRRRRRAARVSNCSEGRHPSLIERKRRPVRATWTSEPPQEQAVVMGLDPFFRAS